MMSEKCDRCGSVGEDRRTLQMACFYAMNELGVPFNEQLLTISGRQERVGTKFITEHRFPFAEWGPIDDLGGKTQTQHVFTLRVCKRCRAEWMAAIQAWFLAAPQSEDHDADSREPGCGSGIFVRENGAVREVTEEEWQKMAPDREPVRAVPEAGRIDKQ